MEDKHRLHRVMCGLMVSFNVYVGGVRRPSEVGHAALVNGLVVGVGMSEDEPLWDYCGLLDGDNQEVRIVMLLEGWICIEEGLLQRIPFTLKV